MIAYLWLIALLAFPKFSPAASDTPFLPLETEQASSPLPPSKPNPFYKGYLIVLRSQIKQIEAEREVIFNKIRQLQIILRPDTTPLSFPPLDPEFLNADISTLQARKAFSIESLEREQGALHQMTVCLSYIISNGSLPPHFWF